MTDAQNLLPAKSRTSASLDGFVPNAKTCPRRPPTTPVSRIRPCGPNKRPSEGLSSRTRQTLSMSAVHRASTPLVDNFRLGHGNLSAIGCPRGVWTALAPIMAIISAADTSCRIRSAFFPKRKVYGQANHARITCNTYSAAYKGKPRKKRLSPKSPNTLIHQCITFYVFLIFQYLSLWKSVFSPN